MKRRAVAVASIAAATLLAFASPASAHGAPTGKNLPLPEWQFQYALVAALIVAFLATRVLWPKPPFDDAAAGRPLPHWVDRVAFLAGVVVRVLGVVLWGFMIAAAWFGSSNSRENLAPVMVYVELWVGVHALSALLGDVWRVLSPFDTIAAIAQWVRTRQRPGPAEERPDDGSLFTSHWLAATGVLGFVWLELCYHARDEPRTLAILMTGYSAVMFAGAARYGRDWLRSNEAFAVLFGLVASLSPLFRDADGTLRVRVPFSGLADVAPRRGTIAVLVIVLGGAGFDGVGRTTFWQKVLGKTSGWGQTSYQSFGLLWIVGIVGVAYLAATMAAAWIGRTDRDLAPRRFGAMLIPVALGATVAHYLSLFITESQAALALLSDPFGRGWNWFGTATVVVNLQLLSPHTIAWVQATAIVVGLAVAVVFAYDRTAGEVKPRLVTRSQYPLLALTMALGVSAMTLLLGA